MNYIKFNLKESVRALMKIPIQGFGATERRLLKWENLQ